MGPAQKSCLGPDTCHFRASDTNSSGCCYKTTGVLLQKPPGSYAGGKWVSADDSTGNTGAHKNLILDRICHVTPCYAEFDVNTPPIVYQIQPNDFIQRIIIVY